MSWNLKVNNIGGLRGEYSYGFDDGINIINAPNATGKSSAINALRLVLGGGQMDNLAQYINDSSEYAEVVLEDGETHRISLSRSGDEAEILSREAPYENEQVEDLVFLTEDAPIHQAVVEGDEEMLGRWLSNITDIEYYEIARDRARSVMQEYSRQKEQARQQVEGSVQEVNELIEELEQELEEVTSEIDEILDSDEYQDIKSELQEERDKKEELEDDVDEINRNINQFQTEIENARRTLEERQERKEELEQRIKDLKKQRTQGEQKIDELREKANEYEDKIDELERELEGKQEERNGRTVVIEEGIRTRLENKERRLERREQIENYSECPYCGQDLTAEQIKEEIEELKKDIEDLRHAKKQRERKIADFRAERRGLLDEIEEIREEIPGKIDEAEDELTGVKNTISNKKTEIQEKESKIEELEEEKDSLNKQIADVEERITELASTNEEHRKRLNSLHEREKEVKNRLENARERRAKYQRGTERLEELQEKEEVAEQIVRHFSDRIEMVNTQMLGELNDALKRNFELLELAEFEKIRVERERTGGFSLDLTRLDEDGRPTPTSLSELSGAERRVVALLVQYVAKTTFAPDIPLFVVDEVSNAMDDERFRRVMQELENELDTLIVTRNVPLEGETEILQQKHIANDIEAVV